MHAWKRLTLQMTVCSCSPVSLQLCLPNRPITTFLPLAIVLGVSMFKEALEDIQRFQADREVNRRGVLVYSAPASAWVRKQWRDIVVRLPRTYAALQAKR